jgi:hypothetical protein
MHAALRTRLNDHTELLCGIKSCCLFHSKEIVALP